MANDPKVDEDVYTCWCGAKGTYEELCDVDGLDSSCGGTGYVDCYCGGDQCVCHHHGQEQECPGCDECPERDDDDGKFYGHEYDESDDYPDGA